MTTPTKFNVYELTREWLAQSQVAFLAEASIASTSDLAKNEAFSRALANEKIYLTDIQTKGRGRGSNTWLTPPSGDALLMTWSTRVEHPVQAVTGPLLGLAVYRALARTLSLPRLSIKPPNDIYYGHKKILGILAEALQQGDQHHLMVGLGLNVFSYPKEVDIAGCLNDCLGDDHSHTVQLTAQAWQKFLTSLLQELRAAARASTGATMNRAHCDELLAALKLHPNGQRYSEVLPNGDLRITSGQTLSWRDL